MTDLKELRRLMAEAVSEAGNFSDDWRWLSSPLNAQERAVAAAVNALPALLDEVERLREVILWALGERDDFPARPEKIEGKPHPMYWWRTELRRRAALREKP